MAISRRPQEALLCPSWARDGPALQAPTPLPPAEQGLAHPASCTFRSERGPRWISWGGAVGVYTSFRGWSLVGVSPPTAEVVLVWPRQYELSVVSANPLGAAQGVIRGRCNVATSMDAGAGRLGEPRLHPETLHKLCNYLYLSFHICNWR